MKFVRAKERVMTWEWYGALARRHNVNLFRTLLLPTNVSFHPLFRLCRAGSGRKGTLGSRFMNGPG